MAVCPGIVHVDGGEELTGGRGKERLPVFFFQGPGDEAGPAVDDRFGEQTVAVEEGCGGGEPSVLVTRFRAVLLEAGDGQEGGGKGIKGQKGAGGRREKAGFTS